MKPARPDRSERLVLSAQQALRDHRVQKAHKVSKDQPGRLAQQERPEQSEPRDLQDLRVK